MKICPACSREWEDEHEVCPEDGVSLVHLDSKASGKAEGLVGSLVGGRYRIERVVGKGGMGVVYACRHVVVGRALAIKVLRSNIERSEEVLQRFIREAQAANAIRSRHICEMVDFGQLESGAFYVVMELLEGASMTRTLKRGTITRDELLHVFVQCAETLDKAHAAGILHRDLKPDNVVLVEDEDDPLFVKLVDFGIAKMMRGGATDLTETGVVLGTPFYMSPEQARGDDLDQRTDIYSLGVMMYRAFTGQVPFVANTAMGVLTRHITEPPEPPSRVAEVDGPVERLILRCMEKKPIDRFQSMREVADALRAVRAGDPMTDPRATKDERSGRRAAADPGETIPDREERRAEGPAPRPPPNGAAMKATRDERSLQQRRRVTPPAAAPASHGEGQSGEIATPLARPDDTPTRVRAVPSIPPPLPPPAAPEPPSVPPEAPPPTPPALAGVPVDGSPDDEGLTGEAEAPTDRGVVAPRARTRPGARWPWIGVGAVALVSTIAVSAVVLRDSPGAPSSPAAPPTALDITPPDHDDTVDDAETPEAHLDEAHEEETSPDDEAAAPTPSEAAAAPVEPPPRARPPASAAPPSPAPPPPPPPYDDGVRSPFD